MPLIQRLQVLMKVGSFTGRIRQWHQLEVTQRLQAVTEPEDVVINWQDLQLTTAGFRVEAKQQPINECQRLAAQMLCRDFIRAVVELGSV